jgi:pimeloyl-ACP methyl ester carboxylesterase
MTQLVFAEAGTGRPALIIHGGGGPFTVAPLAAHLAPTMQTFVPTLPGWNGAERDESWTRVSDITGVYLDWLAERDLTDVLVIGSSLGGWIASDLAARDAVAAGGEGRISGVVVIDGAGVEIPGEPARSFFGLTPQQIAEYSWHDPALGLRNLTTITPEQLAAQKENMATMALLAGDPYMYDPTLLGRLGDIRIPVLLIWGDSDRVFTPGYGAGYAAAFDSARFEIVKDAGHLPQLEQPAATFELIDSFVAD